MGGGSDKKENRENKKLNLILDLMESTQRN